MHALVGLKLAVDTGLGFTWEPSSVKGQMVLPICPTVFGLVVLSFGSLSFLLWVVWLVVVLFGQSCRTE